MTFATVIFLSLIHFRLLLVSDVWGLSDAFHATFVYVWLAVGGWAVGWGGRGPERGIIEVRASVYVCVWVSISLFPLIPTTASS